jgi:general stress protein 26
MENKAAANQDVKKLGELIKDIKFAMLTTVEPDGSLHSRPMATQEVDFDGDLWFFTGASTAKVDEVRHDQHVNVSYAEPGDNTFVSVSGKATVVRDRAKAKELWNPVYKAWFPKGLDDPDLALLKVSVEKAEFWDSPSSKVVQLLGFAKAIATGERARGAGEHGTLDMK